MNLAAPPVESVFDVDIDAEERSPELFWMRVVAELRSPDYVSRVDDPCLQLGDARELAHWLRNVAQDVLQMPVMDFMEPTLELYHVGTLGDAVSLRISCDDDSRTGRPVALTVPRSQVVEAAASLSANTDRLVRDAGLIEEPGQIATCRFYVEWAAVMPGKTRGRALRAVQRFCETLDLEPEIHRCGKVLGGSDLWYVLFRTQLGVPAERAADALIRFLYRFPQYNGAPRIGMPLLWPDGRFHCHGSIFFTDEDLGLMRVKTPFEGLRLWFEVANVPGIDVFPNVSDAG